MKKKKTSKKKTSRKIHQMDGWIDRCINGAMTRMTMLFIKHCALVASEVQSGGRGVISAPALCLGDWAPRGEQTGRKPLLHVFWLFYSVTIFSYRGSV